MILKFEIRPASKCPKIDVIAAIGIYSETVDVGSRTDTNQIKDCIWNTKCHHTESRDLFFYLLYGNDNEVEGFSEFAYLRSSGVLVLDYLCTKKRNPMLFYNFYHMVIQEIETELKKRALFIQYIVTELSLTQVEGKLIDRDSNYFRHLLSNEDFKLLKYPYYQPPLRKNENAMEFNLAIKRYSTTVENSFILGKEQYLHIVEDIYKAHYLDWYCGFWEDHMYEQIIDDLLKRIQTDFPAVAMVEPIALVQCKLFEDGECPKFEAENYTISTERRHRHKKLLIIITWLLFSSATFVFCVLPIFSKLTTELCSFLTIIAGIISIITYRHDVFHR